MLNVHTVSYPSSTDSDIYKWCHPIENFFGKLKEFKRAAMRADKDDTSFSSAIFLTTAIINSRSISTDPRRARRHWSAAAQWVTEGACAY